MKALVFKELREIFGIAVVATGCYLTLVIYLTNAEMFNWVLGVRNEITAKGIADEPSIPFISDDFLKFYSYISMLFAGALGLWQPICESSQGAYLFLLHRPRSRNAIFLTKLATGLSVLLLCSSLPIVLYGWWASVPGHHPSPFTWSMTEEAWKFALVVPLLYFGAFLSGLRPARWFGTRLLPLASSAAFLAILMIAQSWWLIGILLAIILYAMLVASVCYVAQVRDYA